MPLLVNQKRKSQMNQFFKKAFSLAPRNPLKCLQTHSHLEHGKIQLKKRNFETALNKRGTWALESINKQGQDNGSRAASL